MIQISISELVCWKGRVKNPTFSINKINFPWGILKINKPVYLTKIDVENTFIIN